MVQGRIPCDTLDTIAAFSFFLCRIRYWGALSGTGERYLVLGEHYLVLGRKIWYWGEKCGTARSSTLDVGGSPYSLKSRATPS